MAGVHRLHVAEDVGDGQPALADAAVEVLLVALERLALVEPHQVVLPELVLVPILLDRLAGDLSAVDEDAALVALEEDAVVAAAGDDHLDAAGKLALHGEIVRRVVAVVHGRIAVLEGHGMLGVGAVDFDRPHACCVLPDGPGGDVDVVGAPVGELAARVFVPPAELVVAALLDVVDLRRLAEPDVPVEFLGRLGNLGNGPPVGQPLMPTVIFWMSPSSPFCTMLTARRKRSRSLRCCVPTKNTLLGYFWQALRISWFSSSVSVSGFWQKTCLPACRASMAILTCQWSGVTMLTTSMSLRSSTLR